MKIYITFLHYKSLKNSYLGNKIPTGIRTSQMGNFRNSMPMRHVFETQE